MERVTRGNVSIQGSERRGGYSIGTTLPPETGCDEGGATNAADGKWDLVAHGTDVDQ